MSGAYAEFFQRTFGHPPRDWQARLGDDERCRDRLLRIPTGFGKTAGVTLAWLHHRVARKDPSWPTRLVLVLPMRVLVEQTLASVRSWLERAGLAHEVGVHLLMGGADAGPFHLAPEKPAILVGTLDMVLSRALMRGFAAARGRWPIDFGLLHQDALWVLDEVQLMDVGLATSAQLAAFRTGDAERSLRPTHSWWMSATLQPRWLATVDHAPQLPALEHGLLSIPAAERAGGLFDVRKAVRLRPDLATPKEVAALAVESVTPGALTLVIANTVDRAREIHEGVLASLTEGKGAAKRLRPDAPDVRLVHSRFRPHERAAWDFLRGDAKVPAEGRLIVATQVVEAGVDISSVQLLTDLAPWPSIVQRIGRCARYAGEAGTVTVVGTPGAKLVGPYDEADLAASATALAALGSDAGPASLENFEEKLSEEQRATLYRYEPLHVLRRVDLDELFDTSPDLSGGDIDPSRFIRSGDDRDVTVVWRELGAVVRRDLGAVVRRDLGATNEARRLSRVDCPLPARDELLRLPIGDARKWLGGVERAYAFDYLEGAWKLLKGSRDLQRLHPGSLVLVPSTAGGYSVTAGFDAKSKEAVPEVAHAIPGAAELASEVDDDESLSAAQWKSIATHGRETAEEARRIAAALGLSRDLGRLLELSARWHDAGKAHEVFQSAISEKARSAAGEIAAGHDLAKAPSGAWVRGAYETAGRPGFRHELASLLALFELLRRAHPLHEALLGPHRETFAILGEPLDESPATDAIDAGLPIAAELVALDAGELNLVAWLVGTHHGKVRCALAGTPKDQKHAPEEGRIHGVRDGDPIAPLALAGIDGADHMLPAVELALDLATLGVGRRYGASWVERVEALRSRHGVFVLAYLEALLRAADVVASQREGVLV